MKNNEIKHNIMRDKTHSIPLVKRVNKELKKDFTKVIIRHLLEVWHRSEITKEPLKIKRFSHIRFPRVATAAVWTHGWGVSEKLRDLATKCSDFCSTWIRTTAAATSTYLLLLAGFRLGTNNSVLAKLIDSENNFCALKWPWAAKWRYLDRGMSSDTILQI